MSEYSEGSIKEALEVLGTKPCLCKQFGCKGCPAKWILYNYNMNQVVWQAMNRIDQDIANLISDLPSES